MNKFDKRLKQLQDKFPIGCRMTYNDIYEHNKKNEPDMRPATSNWFVNTLKVTGILVAVVGERITTFERKK